jgi:hypothetical protein
MFETCSLKLPGQDHGVEPLHSVNSLYRLAHRLVSYRSFFLPELQLSGDVVWRVPGRPLGAATHMYRRKPDPRIGDHGDLSRGETCVLPERTRAHNHGNMHAPSSRVYQSCADLDDLSDVDRADELDAVGAQGHSAH